MKIIRLNPFKKDYKSLPAKVQKKVNEQLKLLLTNPSHPSLGTKKMQGKEDIWEGRITRGYRFTFEMKGDTCILRRVGTHDILKRED